VLKFWVFSSVSPRTGRILAISEERIEKLDDMAIFDTPQKVDFLEVIF